MIGSFASGATASLVAKNVTKKYSATVDKIITSGQILVLEVNISQPFEELQGSNSELQLFNPKPINGTYFETNLRANFVLFDLF